MKIITFVFCINLYGQTLIMEHIIRVYLGLGQVTYTIYMVKNLLWVGITQCIYMYMKRNLLSGIQSKYDIQVTRDEMKTTYMLVVRNLDFVDGGDYNCVISIPGLDRNKWPTKTGTLVVHGKSHILEITDPCFIISLQVLVCR